MARVYGIKKKLSQNNVDEKIIKEISKGQKPCEFIFEII